MLYDDGNKIVVILVIDRVGDGNIPYIGFLCSSYVGVCICSDL